MRRLLFSTMILVGLGSLPSLSHAQTVGDAALNDPFLAYYGFFLPRQAALAARPGPEMSINEISAARQVRAITERAGLYEPPAGLGMEGYDPNRPFANQSAFNRRTVSRTGVTNANIGGTGPAEYYNRAQAYYPGLRTGRSANSYVASSGRGGRGGRGGGGARVSSMMSGQMNPMRGVPRGVNLNRNN